jgi:hypothetical protein
MRAADAVDPGNTQVVAAPLHPGGQVGRGRVGVAKASVYLNFRSKADLVAGPRTDYIQELVDRAVRRWPQRRLAQQQSVCVA